MQKEWRKVVHRKRKEEMSKKDPKFRLLD